MRILLVILLVVLSSIVYLNRTYAKFYDTIKTSNLKPPSEQTVLNFENPQSQNYQKIVILGDSLSAGTGATATENTLGYLIGKMQSEKFKGVRVSIWAKPGATTADVIKFQLRGAFTENPDVVTLLIGINDIHDLKPYAEYSENYKTILTELSTKTQSKIILFTIPFLGSDKTLIFPYNYILKYRTNQFNRVIKTYCNFPNVSCIDLYTETELKFKFNPAFYSEDGFHPSDIGYKLWASLIHVD